MEQTTKFSWLSERQETELSSLSPKLSLTSIAERRFEMIFKAIRIAVIALISIYILYIMVMLFHPLGPPRRVLVQSMNESVMAMRTAINQFHSDTGRYPIDLREIFAPNETQLLGPVPKGSYHGPYISTSYREFLPNPLTPKIDNGAIDPVVEHHWLYDPKTGKIESAVKK